LFLSTPPLVGVAYGGVWGWCRGRHRAVEQCRHLEACRRAGAGGAVGDGGVVCCVVARARAKASRAGPEVAVVVGARRLVGWTRAMRWRCRKRRVESGRLERGRRRERLPEAGVRPCRAKPGQRAAAATPRRRWGGGRPRCARPISLSSLPPRGGVGTSWVEPEAVPLVAPLASCLFFAARGCCRRRRGVGVGALLCGWGGAVGATAASMSRASPREAGQSVAAVATEASVGTEAAPWVALPLRLCHGSCSAGPRSRLPSPSWGGRRRVGGGGGFAGCVAAGVAGGPSGLRWRRCRRRWWRVVGGLVAGRKETVGGLAEAAQCRRRGIVPAAWLRGRAAAAAATIVLVVSPVAPPRAVSGSHQVGAMQLSPPREGASWVWMEAVPWAPPHRFMASPREAVWLAVVAARRASVGAPVVELEVVACYRWHAPRATVQGPRIARPDGRSLPPPRGERRCGGRTVVPPPPWAGVRRLSGGRRRRCGAAAGLWANVGAAWRASACVGSGWRAGVVCGAGGPRCCRVRGCGCRCRLLRQVDVWGVASSASSLPWHGTVGGAG